MQHFHHTTGYPRHVRRGRDHALARHADRHGGAGARRQCVRCCGRGWLRAADRRAASQRAGRRVAGDRVARGRARARGDLRTGAVPGRRDASSGCTAMGLRRCPAPGLLPAVVPGAFDGWMLLLRDYGTLKLRDVLSYAIGYAEHGFPLVPRIVSTIIPAVDYFQTEWPSSGAVWLVNGRPPHPDKPFRTPAIAETYRRILAEAEAAGGDRIRQIEAARHAFYKGFVAEAIDRFYRQRADGLDRRAPSRTAHRRRPRALRGARRATGCRSTITGSRCTSSGRGRRGRCCCRRCVCSRASTSPRWTRSGRSSCTQSSRR